METTTRTAEQVAALEPLRPTYRQEDLDDMLEASGALSRIVDRYAERHSYLLDRGELEEARRLSGEWDQVLGVMLELGRVRRAIF